LTEPTGTAPNAAESTSSGVPSCRYPAKFVGHQGVDLQVVAIVSSNRCLTCRIPKELAPTTPANPKTTETEPLTPRGSGSAAGRPARYVAHRAFTADGRVVPSCRSREAVPAGRIRSKRALLQSGDGDCGLTSACFELSLSVDAHTASMLVSEERAIDGVTSGALSLGDVVTWQARHFGTRFTMTSAITAYAPPSRFVDEQQHGPFTSWWHEHLYAARDWRDAHDRSRQVPSTVEPVGFRGGVPRPRSVHAAPTSSAQRLAKG